jgi:diguanylate cyclase (GGDEF)-like protein
MQITLMSRRLRHLLVRHHAILLACVVLIAITTAAVYVAYAYDIFPNDPGVASRARTIELDEALAIAALFGAGLLALSWRFTLLQRREVARRIRAEHVARELARQDTLTGLPNRRRFNEEMNAAIAAPPRTDGTHAVFILDLNDFKRVNDVYGHGTGDEVLIEVARRLQRAVRDGDLVVRLGGDEFAILARQLAGAEDATTIAQRVINELDAPITVGATRQKVGVGIGIALFPQDAATGSELLRKADIALYRAKTVSGSAIYYFAPEMDATVRDRELIQRELSAAIANRTVRPYFQPLVDLRTKRIVGFEALARWTHPTLGDIAPDRFIPIAESCGLMNELTDCLLSDAVNAASTWPEDVTLAFNISPSQLKDHTLALRILATLAKSGLSPHRLEIEITESALVDNLEGAQRVLGELRTTGVRIALDDFGTGYSSLYHLRNLKIDKVKIERMFVQDMESDPEAATMVRALLGFGHGLGLTVTAEGVLNSLQAKALTDEGCDQGQGYLYSPAISAGDTVAFIAAHAQNEAQPSARVA